MLRSGVDFKAIAIKSGFPVWCVPGFVLASAMGAGIADSIAKKNLDMKPAKAYGMMFKEAMGDKPFHGGDAPGQGDLSYYGTIKSFHCGEGSVVDLHLKETDLSEWYDRCDGAMPLVEGI